MSTIITRNSATSGSIPSSLVQGELAINVTDGRLFYGSGSGNVVKEFTGSASGGSTNTGSLLTTSSFSNPNLTFTKGNGSTFNVNLVSLVPTSASYAVTASFITASGVYGPYGSNSVISASYAETASSALNAQDILIKVLNQSGNPIAKGVVVHITASGNSSDIPRVITASYENDNNSANTLGITNQAIANGAEGFIMTEGVLRGINTSAFVSGQLIYLGATGSIIGTAPVAPLHNVRLGQVVREQSNNGSIYVRIDNGYELEELHDVLIVSASSGDLVVRSGSIWVNSRQLTGSYGLTGSLHATSFTGSLDGTASYATQALSSSFASTSSFTPNALTTASVSSNTITFTKGDGTTFPITVDTGSGGAAFPFTGSAGITGSLIVTGSINSRLTVDSGLGFQQAQTASYSMGSQIVGGNYLALDNTSSIAHTVYSNSLSDIKIGVSTGTTNIPSLGANIPSQIVGFSLETGSNYTAIFAQRVDLTALGSGPSDQAGILSVFGGNEQYEVRTSSANKSLGFRKYDTAGKFIQLNLQSSETGFNLSNNLTSSTASLFKINNSTSNIIFETFQDNKVRVSGSLIVTAVAGTFGLNTQTGVLSGTAGVTSVDWNSRWLTDSGAITKLDWESGVTYDSIGKDSVNWQNRQLLDSAVTTTVDWENTQTYDSSTNLSINWSQRRLHDSAGTTILDWENGTLSGNATTATTATSASFASTASFVNPLNQQVVITGSLRGNVSALSISSNTASLDMRTNNFFTLNLVNGANTHINPTNLQPGQTVNIRVNQGSLGTGTVSFPSFVDQPSGSAYTGSQVANAIDIVTMITFDSSLVFVSSVRNMI